MSMYTILRSQYCIISGYVTQIQTVKHFKKLRFACKKWVPVCHSEFMVNKTNCMVFPILD